MTEKRKRKTENFAGKYLIYHLSKKFDKNAEKRKIKSRTCRNVRINENLSKIQSNLDILTLYLLTICPYDTKIHFP